MKVGLTYPTPEGSKTIYLEESSRLTIGRSSEADLHFNEDALSRLHASIYREKDRVWIVDENSTNGTSVNGQPVSASGKLLKNGDIIELGKKIKITVQVEQNSKTEFSLLPIVIIASSFFLLVFALSFIVIKTLTSTERESYPTRKPTEIEKTDSFNSFDSSPTPARAENAEKVEKAENKESYETTNTVQTTPIRTQARKKFYEMTDSEKDEYIKEKAEKISRIIGNQVAEPIPPEAVKSIRVHLQGYINRIRQNRIDDCRQGSFTRSDTVTILERASRNAPFIIRSFYAEGLDPQIGIYVAMIESEHCPCLQSPTGALGMFQFVRSTGREFGLQIKQDASPTNPDERCDPEKAAKAAARYLKSLISRFGSGPISFPLAIASYNSGQGGLSQNLEKALKKAADQERSFWTLVANQQIFEGKIGEQFRRENVKYVPKFFAAAIIGENPQDFGINLAPISTYTKPNY